MPEWMITLDFILRVVFILAVLGVGLFQIKIIKAQNKIIKGQEGALDFFTALSESTRQQYEEREELVSKIREKEKVVMEQQFKELITKEQESGSRMADQVIALLSVFSQVSYWLTGLKQFESAIETMTDGIAKNCLMNMNKTVKQTMKELKIDPSMKILVPIFMQMESQKKLDERDILK